MTRTCKSARCDVEFEPFRKQLFCSSTCRTASDYDNRLKRNNEQEKAIRLAPRACVECQAEYTPVKVTQKYCGIRCNNHAQRARDLVKYGSKLPRTGRTCKDCSISIDDQNISALRCVACRKKKKNNWRRNEQVMVAATRRVNQKTGNTLHRKPKAPNDSLKTKVKVDPKLPNYGGDWYPGWTGPWCPSVGVEGGKLIEKWLQRGPAPTSDPQVKQTHKEEAAA